MTKPAKWHDPAHKLFAHQVGFTAPPKDWDAAPSDFLRMSPPTVGVHGRLLHAADYAHTLDQRAANFGQLEEFVHAMSNAWGRRRRAGRYQLGPRRWHRPRRHRRVHERTLGTP